MTTPQANRRLASLQEVCEYLGVSDVTARKMIARGLFPAYRLGDRLLRVDLDEVDAALRPIPTAGG